MKVISSLKHHGTIYSKMKICCTCKLLKELHQYYASKSTKDGYQRQCKQCKKDSSAPTSKARSKRYRHNNKEKHQVASKRWRESNKDYYITYYKNNKDKWLQRTKSYSYRRYKSDPAYRVRRVLCSQIWSFLKGKTKKDTTSKLLGYTYNDFVIKLGTGKPSQEIDHKIPSTWFNEGTPVAIVWHLDNLQWIDSVNNRSKGNRYAHQVTEDYLQIALPYIREECVVKLKTRYL